MMEIPYTVAERPDTGLYNGKLGIWLFLASEVMLFGGLFSSYILLRTGDPNWSAPELSVPMAAARNDKTIMRPMSSGIQLNSVKSSSRSSV